MSSRGCCRPTIAQFARLRSQCLRWSEDHAAELTGADPSLPKALDDRAADNWRPLKAIADVLGDRWSKLCSDAAEVLSRERGEDETTGVALLLALKAIFADARRRRSSTGRASRTARRCTPTAILPKLHDADSRWKEYGRSEKPITDKGLARLLKGFRIKPGLVTIAGTEKRGYRVADFDDAFGRYCPSPCCDFCGEGERADDPLLTSLRRRGERAPAPLMLAVMGARRQGDHDPSPLLPRGRVILCVRNVASLAGGRVSAISIRPIKLRDRCEPSNPAVL